MCAYNQWNGVCCLLSQISTPHTCLFYWLCSHYKSQWIRVSITTNITVSCACFKLALHKYKSLNVNPIAISDAIFELNTILFQESFSICDELIEYCTNSFGSLTIIWKDVFVLNTSLILARLISNLCGFHRIGIFHELYH